MTISEKIPLSVAVITLNEEDRIGECLQSVAFASDIVVVDSGSSDNTVSIAREYGARIFQEPWHGFGPQKQLAIDQCHNQLILLIDADERIPSETAAEIKALLQGESQSQAYSFPRKNYFSGRWIRHGGWWPDRVARLFQKEYGRMSSSMVHESLIVDGAIGELSNPIVHHINSELHHVIEKINRYSSIGAEELFQKGESSSILKAFLRGSWAFFYNYVVRLGFLDKSEGLLIAICDGVNKFYKYAKLKQMNDRVDE